jgi:hypothetical protein
MDGGGDDVANGLRFSGARRTLHNQISTCSDRLNDDCLGRVGVDHLNEIRRGKEPVEWRVLCERRGFLVKAFREQASQKRMVNDGLLAPRGRLEVAYHQELGERIEAEFHAVGVAPSQLFR